MITKAGMPSYKIIVGITSYGRSFKMTTKGCTGPMCKFTGPSSGAAPGKCTGTAGYLADAEIKDMISRGGNIQESYDSASSSDILVYDNTEWVAYMKKSTRDARSLVYKDYSMGGTVNWAIDLEDTVPLSPAGVVGIGTTFVQHISPAKATVIPYSETTVKATATFTLQP